MTLYELIDKLEEIRCVHGNLPVRFAHDTVLVDPDTGEQQYTESEIDAVQMTAVIEKRVLLSGGIT